MKQSFMCGNTADKQSLFQFSSIDRFEFSYLNGNFMHGRVVYGVEHKSDKYEIFIQSDQFATFIVENYKKPAICLCITENEGIFKGSARSVEGFNLKAALDDCAKLLVGYGGHPMAAGLSIKEENVELLREKMNALADHTSDL